jgi:hypothetical protein
MDLLPLSYLFMWSSLTFDSETILCMVTMSSATGHTPWPPGKAYWLTVSYFIADSVPVIRFWMEPVVPIVLHHWFAAWGMLLCLVAPRLTTGHGENLLVWSLFIGH